jgi:hypothetical protein
MKLKAPDRSRTSFTATAYRDLPLPSPTTLCKHAKHKPPMLPKHGALTHQGFRESAITCSRSAFQALIAFHRLLAPLTASLHPPCSKSVAETSVAKMFNATGVSHLKLCNHNQYIPLTLYAIWRIVSGQ